METFTFELYLFIHKHFNSCLFMFSESNFNQIFRDLMGHSFGSVGRAVISDTRGPQFESSHRQIWLNIYCELIVKVYLGLARNFDFIPIFFDRSTFILEIGQS